MMMIYATEAWWSLKEDAGAGAQEPACATCLGIGGALGSARSGAAVRVGGAVGSACFAEG